MRDHGLRHTHPAGFTLVELLVTASLLVVVVGAVGSVLVSELNSTTTLQRSIGQSEDIARVRSQLQREVALAARVSTSDSLPKGCSNITNPLVLIGPGNAWSIAYGLRSQGPNNAWRGPNQLLRCGPSYNQNGFDAAGALIESVVADRVPNAGFSATLSGDSKTISRDIEITLKINNPSSNDPASTSFRAQVDSNRLNNFLDRPDLAGDSSSDEAIGDDNYTHWRASGGSIKGDPNRINLIYFPNPSSSYTITSGCNRASCTVSGATITNGTALIFSDREIRLP